MSNELVLRCQMESYMECGSGETKAYNLIGEGFTAFPIALNPKEYTRKYVNYKTEKSDVIGYAPSVSYSCDCISGDPVVKEIVAITDAEALGTATHRNVVTVNAWEEGENGDCPAYMRTYAIIPAGKGDGTDALVYTGTMKAVSDQVKGTFNRTSKKFTPETAAAAQTEQTAST